MHRMYRIPDRRYRENLDRCVELLDLGELLEVPVRQLSLGQRMRGDIAAALLHDPEVLYLDEPTIGLDVVSKVKVRQFLKDLNAERGTTVLLTTHDLTDIEQLCSRVMVIDHGRLMYDGSLAGLHEVGESERMLVVDLERELPPIRLESEGAEGAARAGRQGGGAAPVAGVPRRGVGGPAGGADRRGVSAGRPVGAGAGHRGRDREDVRVRALRGAARHGPGRAGPAGSWLAHPGAAPDGPGRFRVGPRPVLGGSGCGVAGSAWRAVGCGPVTLGLGQVCSIGCGYDK